MVDLSEVTARRRDDGEMAREKMVAWSRPRRSSTTMQEVVVEKTRIRVPCRTNISIMAKQSQDSWWLTLSEAVAIKSPVGLMVIAANDVVCAGMMVTFPEVRSNSWRYPAFLPGKASVFAESAHSPKGLSCVSNTCSFSGGWEKAYICTEFNKTAIILDRDIRTALISDRNSRENAVIALTSFHITTYAALG